MLRSTRLYATLAVGVVLLACSGDHGPFDPLSGGLEIPVRLETLVDLPPGPPPGLDFAATPGELLVMWDVTSAPCLVATASALQSGSVVEVRIHRSGNSLALCVDQPASYSYVAHVPLAPGAYEVRLVDDLLGQPLRPVGRSTVEVTP
jgi:hypothetical protein